MLSDASWTYLILVRWIHVSFACLLLGATFCMGMLLTTPPSAEAEPLRTRHRFKMVVHSSLLFLLLSGSFNAWLYWKAYRLNMPLTHALFGPHVFLALIVFTILLVMLARKQPRDSERMWLKIAAVLLFLTVLMASSLKYAREHPKVQATTRGG